jgi:hypothetical protein
MVLNEKEYKEFKKKKSLQKFVTDEAFFYKDVIRLTITVGDQFLSNKRMPSRFFPLIPIPYIFTGNTFPMSLSELLLGKQKEMNSAHQIMLHNANLGSNLRWMYREGAINVTKWQDYAASSGALLPVNPGQEFPKEIMPLPLSNAFFGIVEQGKSDFEYLSGVFRSSFGDAAAMHDTAKGQQRADQFGTRRTRQWVDNVIEPALQQVGLVFKDYAQALYQSHKIITLQGDQFDYKTFEINVPKPGPDGTIISRFNDYKSANFDVKIVPASTLPTNQEEKFNKMLMMKRENIINRDLVIMASPDIENKKEVLEQLGENSMLKREVQTLQDKIKKFEGDVQSLERMVVTSRIQAEVTNMSAKLRNKIKALKRRNNWYLPIISCDKQLTSNNIRGRLWMKICSSLLIQVRTATRQLPLWKLVNRENPFRINLSKIPVYSNL